MHDELAVPLAPGLTHKAQKHADTNVLGLLLFFIAYLVLVVTTLVLSIQATQAVFSTPTRGSIISAGRILDGFNASESTPWRRACSNFGGRGLLSRHQFRELYTLRTLIQAQSGPDSTLLSACMAEKSFTTNMSYADRWERGLSVEGVFFGASPSPYTPQRATQLFAWTDAPSNQFGAPVALSECSSLIPALAALGLEDYTVYTDTPRDVCDKLQKIDWMATPPPLTLDFTKTQCTNTVASARTAFYAQIYNRTIPPYIEDLFITLKNAALRHLGGLGPRFKAKLQALKLLPATYASQSLLPVAESFLDWYMAFKHREWLRGWNPPDTTHPEMTPWSVNAYYDMTQNVVFVPPALLTITPDDAAAPFMLATVGFILAHEISHATDPRGILFDALGTYAPTPYPKQYQAFIDCLASNAQAAYIHVNQTLGENYADTLGWALLHSVPGLQETPSTLQKLGFASGYAAAKAAYAKMWCSNPDRVTAEDRNHTIYFDAHPPADFRVDSVLGSPLYSHCSLF